MDPRPCDTSNGDHIASKFSIMSLELSHYWLRDCSDVIDLLTLLQVAMLPDQSASLWSHAYLPMMIPKGNMTVLRVEVSCWIPILANEPHKRPANDVRLQWWKLCLETRCHPSWKKHHEQSAHTSKIHLSDGWQCNVPCTRQKNEPNQHELPMRPPRSWWELTEPSRPCCIGWLLSFCPYWLNAIAAKWLLAYQHACREDKAPMLAWGQNPVPCHSD